MAAAVLDPVLDPVPEEPLLPVVAGAELEEAGALDAGPAVGVLGPAAEAGLDGTVTTEVTVTVGEPAVLLQAVATRLAATITIPAPNRRVRRRTMRFSHPKALRAHFSSQFHYPCLLAGRSNPRMAAAAGCVRHTERCWPPSAGRMAAPDGCVRQGGRYRPPSAGPVGLRHSRRSSRSDLIGSPPGYQLLGT